MLEPSSIRPLDSSYGALVLFVSKKDRRLWFYIDYRWINKKMPKDNYPLQLAKEEFNCLGSSRVFNKIGASLGYWKMLVKQEDADKMALKKRWWYEVPGYVCGMCACLRFSRWAWTLYNHGDSLNTVLVVIISSVRGWIHILSVVLFDCDLILVNHFGHTVWHPAELPLAPHSKASITG